MGRAPCCDKANVKKGPWAHEEDAKLKSYIEQHGTGGNWIALPKKIGLKRCGKSCRLRWLNYLRPNIKHGGFSQEEDNVICSLFASIGSRWSIIAAQLPGRTDNDIKNYWNTRLKKKLLGKQRKEQSRRGTTAQKQEMRRERENNSISMVTDDNPQNPYWPELPLLPPVPYWNHDQESHFNDHNSIRKLLIKLGGRFSCNDTNENQLNHISQFPFDTSILQPSHEQFIDTVSASSSLPSSQFNNVDGQGGNLPILLPGQSCNFPSVLEEMVFSSSPQKLDGMELLYGEMGEIKANGSTNTNICRGSMDNWGEMSSLISHTSTLSGIANSNYEGILLQECAYNELNYPGAN